MAPVSNVSGDIFDFCPASEHTWLLCPTCNTGMNSSEAFAGHRCGKSCIKAHRNIKISPPAILQTTNLARTEEGLVINYDDSCPLGAFLADLAAAEDGMQQTEVVERLSAIEGSLNGVNQGVISESLLMLDDNKGVHFCITTTQDSPSDVPVASKTWWLTAKVKNGIVKQQESAATQPACSVALPTNASRAQLGVGEPLRTHSSVAIHYKGCTSEDGCHCQKFDHLFLTRHPNQRAFILRHPELPRLRSFFAEFRDILT